MQMHTKKGVKMKDRRFIDVDASINRMKEQLKDAPDEYVDYILQSITDIEAEFHAQESEQELFWKLPCKVGDYVYQIDRTHWKIHTRKVSKIELAVTATDFTMTIYFETAGFCYFSHFGKTVFLDKKDALDVLDPYSVG